MGFEAPHRILHRSTTDVSSAFLEKCHRNDPTAVIDALELMMILTKRLEERVIKDESLSFHSARKVHSVMHNMPNTIVCFSQQKPREICFQGKLPIHVQSLKISSDQL